MSSLDGPKVSKQDKENVSEESNHGIKMIDTTDGVDPPSPVRTAYKNGLSSPNRGIEKAKEALNDRRRKRF